MSNPEIATILENGLWGQRPMTDDEFTEYLASIDPNSLPQESGRPE